MIPSSSPEEESFWRRSVPALALIGGVIIIIIVALRYKEQNPSLDEEPEEEIEDIFGEGIFVNGTMSCEEVRDFLFNDNYTNPLYLAKTNDRFGIEILIEEPDGRFISSIRQDRNRNTTFYAFNASNDTMEINYQVKKTNDGQNIFLNGTWYYSRDEVPDFLDIFATLELIANNIGISPKVSDLNLNNSDMQNLTDNCQVKGFIVRDHLINLVVTSNDERTLTFFIQDEPRRLLELRNVDHETGYGPRFNYYYNEDGFEVAFSTNYTRAPVNIQIDEDIDYPTQSLTIYDGEVTEFHFEEVRNEEIELRILTKNHTEDSRKVLYNETIVASMLLVDHHRNLTDTKGYYWNITWNDTDSNGLVSSNDFYTVETNASSPSDYQIVFFDYWADEYEGGPPWEEETEDIPGLSGSLAILTLLTVGSLYRRRRGSLNAL